jgi:hypothetical protein
MTRSAVVNDEKKNILAIFGKMIASRSNRPRLASGSSQPIGRAESSPVQIPGGQLVLEQFRSEGAFGAWLSRIVENQCPMRIREIRQYQFVYLDEPAGDKVKLELVGQEETPEDQLGTEQVRKPRGRRCVCALPSTTDREAAQR